MLRRMAARQGLISIDIDQGVTDYTARFVKRAGLEDYVQLVVRDSAAPENVAQAKEYLGGDPELIFIDSSHMYEHTVRELAEMIWRKVHGPAEPFRFISDTPYEHDVQMRVPDVRKAREVLGFEASTSLEDVLDEVIPWIREEIAAGKI